jgi:hypothetical protein
MANGASYKGLEVIAPTVYPSQFNSGFIIDDRSFLLDDIQLVEKLE